VRGAGEERGKISKSKKLNKTRNNVERWENALKFFFEVLVFRKRCEWDCNGSRSIFSENWTRKEKKGKGAERVRLGKKSRKVRLG
jgi:hypothetical protein